MGHRDKGKLVLKHRELEVEKKYTVVDQRGSLERNRSKFTAFLAASIGVVRVGQSRTLAG